MVAHRPETLHIAHRIVRLEGGALTEVSARPRP